MSIRNGMQMVIKYNYTGETVKEAIKNDIKMLYMCVFFLFEIVKLY